METLTHPVEGMTPLPDHTQLPDHDDEMLNALGAPQSNMLTESFLPRVRERHPDGQFYIGCSAGIYFRFTEPVLAGCRAPDWFYVPDVPPMLDGKMRRSYVLWKEVVKPLLVAEYVSGDGSDERDTTPHTGKFWIYERAVCAAYYIIFDSERAILEAYRLVDGRYQAMAPNAAGRFLIEPLGVELGTWQGTYREQTLLWLRVWDVRTGTMVPLSDELVEAAQVRAEVAEASVAETTTKLHEETRRADEQARLRELESKRADEQARLLEEEARRAALYVAKLRELGLDPDKLGA